MEIRDVIHDSIEIFLHEEPILDSPFFQRLRNIKQLGFAENSYPGATHNRFIHSLGALRLADQVFKNALLGKAGGFAAGAFVRSKCDKVEYKSDIIQSPLLLFPQDAERLLQTVRIAAMLHDIGHGPLSHTTEFAMPSVQKLGLMDVPTDMDLFNTNRQATHEDYTLKIILQSSLTSILHKALGPLGIRPLHIACLIEPHILCPDDFFKVDGVDYRPILHQIISSEMDVDRMDYLTRDSFHAGVNYGKIDIAWLLANLTHYIAPDLSDANSLGLAQASDKKCYLALQHRAIYTFDDFLISRFHMFLMVYFHHKSVIYDEMLERYLRSEDCNYAIPTDIEEYVFYDDYHLYTHLSRSTNPWAKRIYHKKPYKMLVELHSGIPQGEKSAQEQKELLEKITQDLNTKKQDYIIKTTTGAISKYFKKSEKMPIFVRYDNKYSSVRFIPLEECTDLFSRYPESRSITRIYVDKIE